MKKRNELAQPNTFNVMMRPALRGMTMAKIVLRPGSLDVLAKPSRIGNTLFYPDGRRESAHA